MAVLRVTGLKAGHYKCLVPETAQPSGWPLGWRMNSTDQKIASRWNFYFRGGGCVGQV